MKRVWTVLHHQVPRTDAQRRWDQAYQLLLQCAGPSSSTTQQEGSHTQVVMLSTGYRKSAPSLT